jgi:large subunit ribosomal protein L21
MYAVINTGGKQYKVAPGDTLRVEKLEVEIGSTIELAQVSLLAKDDGIVVDPEALSSARVVCEVLDQDRRKKIRVIKYKRRKNYHRHQGHRQYYTELKVRDIQA